MTKPVPVLELPPTGFLRAKQIIGNPKQGTPALLPVSRSSWWRGVRSGRYPQGFLLSPHIRAWKVEDIRALLANISGGEVA